jgi:hypothetical protein
MARPTTRWIAALLVTGVGMIALARLSAIPISYHRGNDARLRLSWSARPERIEVCRELSREELEKREEHMRERVECDGHFATYELHVTIDGRDVAESVVRGGGFRHDRSMYVLREVDLPSGQRHVHVSFTRMEKVARDTGTLATGTSDASGVEIPASRDERERTERSRRARAAVPSELVLDTTITVKAGQVVVITFDHVRRTLDVIDDRGTLPR